MISYLKDYREEVPAWLSDYLQGKQFSFKDIMSSRVGYYPGSGYDGTLIKVGNMSHSVHSFLYVDYLVKRKELEDHIAQKNSIRGYHPIGEVELQERDIMSNGQYPFNITKEPLHGKPCIIRETHCYPQDVICASNTRIWNGYKQIKDVSPVYGGMHQHRRDLFVFCPAIVARSLEGRSKEQG